MEVGKDFIKQCRHYYETATPIERNICRPIFVFCPVSRAAPFSYYGKDTLSMLFTGNQRMRFFDFHYEGFSLFISIPYTSFFKGYLGGKIFCLLSEKMGMEDGEDGEWRIKNNNSFK